MNPTFLEGLEKIYLLYDGGSALGAYHTYNTRGMGRVLHEPTKYEIRDESAAMKKRKREGNKSKKKKKSKSKKHTKRKKKRKSKRRINKSKMR
jgi:hypothetical protein